MKNELLKIADRLDKRADAIFDNLFREYYRERELAKYSDTEHTIPIPKSQMAGALRIFAEEIRETLEPIEYHTYTEGGDLFTVKKFISACKQGAFIDSDGYGHYAKKVGDHISESNRIASPARFSGGDVNQDYTHVVWYNK